MTANPSPILLIDDDSAFRKVYSALLRQAGHSVTEADDRQSADRAFAQSQHSVVLLDLMLPPDGSAQGGLEQLKAMLGRATGAKIIVVSGAGDLKIMLQAVGAGAYDFLTKPVDPDVLLVVVDRALEKAALEQRIDALQRSLADAEPEGAMIGRSAAFQAATDMGRRVADRAGAGLGPGHPGTANELMGGAAHRPSARADSAFVVVNCGGIPDTLFESAMFGHVRGAFTGAHRDRKGLFAQADGGTIFLDEIGDMPVALQVKLLRTLESGEILPVGADRTVRVDVRLISATNRDLPQLMQSGDFREDLYWRIKGAQIHLPALRDRPADIPLLAAHFLARHRVLGSDGRPRRLSDDALDAMMNHPWPGNLRELRNELQRAAVMVGERSVIERSDLGFAAGPGATSAAPAATLADKVQALERREIEAALTRCHGNRTHAADALGLSRQGLLKKMARYALS